MVTDERLPTHAELVAQAVALDMTYAESLLWWRERYIEQAVAWGMPEELSWVKEPEDPIWPEEKEGVVKLYNGRPSERPKRPRYEPPDDQQERVLRGDWLEEMDRLYPEDVEFFRKLDERFPDGHEWVCIVNPESEVGQRFFDRLKEEFPEAWEFFLADIE